MNRHIRESGEISAAFCRDNTSVFLRWQQLVKHSAHAMALGYAVACLGCAVSNASPDTLSVQQANGTSAPLSDDLLLTQGTTLRHGNRKLGLVNVFNGSEIRLSVWQPGQEDTLTRLRLHPSDAFAVGNGFLRVTDTSTAQSGRATIALKPFRDAGVGVPDASHLLLSQDGQLEIGDQAVAVNGAIGGDSVQLDIWPKRFPRDSVKPKDLQTQVVALGSQLTLKKGKLQVRRLQPNAGELRGFIEFASGE